MKKSVIADISHDKMAALKSKGLPRDAFHKADKMFVELIGIENEFTQDQFELHQAYVAALNEQKSAEIDFYFEQGFKLGLRLGLELLE